MDTKLAQTSVYLHHYSGAMHAFEGRKLQSLLRAINEFVVTVFDGARPARMLLDFAKAHGIGTKKIA